MLTSDNSKNILLSQRRTKAVRHWLTLSLYPTSIAADSDESGIFRMRPWLPLIVFWCSSFDDSVSSLDIEATPPTSFYLDILILKTFVNIRKMYLNGVLDSKEYIYKLISELPDFRVRCLLPTICSFGAIRTWRTSSICDIKTACRLDQPRQHASVCIIIQ